MAEPDVLERLHQRILRTFLESGHAPTYLDLARAEGVSPEDARLALRDLMAAIPGCWQHPGTDHIVAYAPFNNLPTWHRITVGGEQKWTALCGFDALQVTHLFRGQKIQVDSNCLDCGESVQVRMRDGEVLDIDPPEAVAHSNLPLARWFDDFAVT